VVVVSGVDVEDASAQASTDRPPARDEGSESGFGAATRPGIVLAVGASTLAVAVAATTLWTTTLAVGGAVVHAVCVRHDRPRGRESGALALLAAVLAGTLTGVGDLAVLAGVVAVVVAYDAGERTVALHAGTAGAAARAATGRFETRRAAWTLAVCTAAATGGVALARVPTAASPAGAALALAGGVLVAFALRGDDARR
jgi:hypothetical protein